MRFGENRERFELLRVRGSPSTSGAADLRIVSVHLQGVSSVVTESPELKFAIGGRLHADHFRAAGSDQHEVVLSAVGFEEAFHFGDQFILLHADFDAVSAKY